LVIIVIIIIKICKKALTDDSIQNPRSRLVNRPAAAAIPSGQDNQNTAYIPFNAESIPRVLPHNYNAPPTVVVNYSPPQIVPGNQTTTA
jgi:hypothetical protein